MSTPDSKHTPTDNISSNASAENTNLAQAMRQSLILRLVNIDKINSLTNVVSDDFKNWFLGYSAETTLDELAKQLADGTETGMLKEFLDLIKPTADKVKSAGNHIRAINIALNYIYDLQINKNETTAADCFALQQLFLGYINYAARNRLNDPGYVADTKATAQHHETKVVAQVEIASPQEIEIKEKEAKAKKAIDQKYAEIKYSIHNIAADFNAPGQQDDEDRIFAQSLMIRRFEEKTRAPQQATEHVSNEQRLFDASLNIEKFEAKLRAQDAKISEEEILKSVAEYEEKLITQPSIKKKTKTPEAKDEELLVPEDSKRAVSLTRLETPFSGKQMADNLKILNNLLPLNTSSFNFFTAMKIAIFGASPQQQALININTQINALASENDPQEKRRKSGVLLAEIKQLLEDQVLLRAFPEQAALLQQTSSALTAFIRYYDKHDPSIRQSEIADMKSDTTSIVRQLDTTSSNFVVAPKTLGNAADNLAEASNAWKTSSVRTSGGLGWGYGAFRLTIFNQELNFMDEQFAKITVALPATYSYDRARSPQDVLLKRLQNSSIDDNIKYLSYLISTRNTSGSYEYQKKPMEQQMDLEKAYYVCQYLKSVLTNFLTRDEVTKDQGVTNAIHNYLQKVDNYITQYQATHKQLHEVQVRLYQPDLLQSGEVEDQLVNLDRNTVNHK